MKVIFLDVDGVLNTQKQISISGMYAIGEQQLKHLKNIVKKTDAIIVVSSTWRLHDSTFDILKNALEKVGLEVFDRTENLGSVNRIVEIEKWLSRHSDVERFAILDDDSDAGFGHEEAFFKTVFRDGGLTKVIAEKVVEYMNSK